MVDFRVAFNLLQCLPLEQKRFKFSPNVESLDQSLDCALFLGEKKIQIPSDRGTIWIKFDCIRFDWKRFDGICGLEMLRDPFARLNRVATVFARGRTQWDHFDFSFFLVT